MSVEVAGAPRIGAGSPLSPNALRALAAWALAAVIWWWVQTPDPLYARFWIFGLAFGFALQRGRFCFASAFRDLFLMGHGRTMKGVLLGLAVASVGFGVVMARQMPLAASGYYPPTANILPVGVHTALGGLLFGVGMVIAGGCVSGNLYRMGEGYVASWVAFAGILGGLMAATYTWNFWWEASIASSPRIWLPQTLGHSWALVVTLVALALAFLWVLRIEHRAGMVMPASRPPEETPEKVSDDLRILGRRVFVQGWPIAIAGAVLGGLNVLLFMAQQPLGFTGELGRWTAGLGGLVVPPPPLPAAVENLPGCALTPWDGTVLSNLTFMVWGVGFGSFAGALGAGEFKVRVPKQRIRYVQSLGGGVFMGYGAGLAMGCTIGAFFSAIPSLAMNGWVFALFLAGGAWLGTRLLQRIP